MTKRQREIGWKSCRRADTNGSKPAYCMTSNFRRANVCRSVLMNQLCRFPSIMLQQCNNAKESYFRRSPGGPVVSSERSWAGQVSSSTYSGVFSSRWGWLHKGPPSKRWLGSWAASPPVKPKSTRLTKWLCKAILPGSRPSEQNNKMLKKQNLYSLLYSVGNMTK